MIFETVPWLQPLPFVSVLFFSVLYITGRSNPIPLCESSSTSSPYFDPSGVISELGPPIPFPSAKLSVFIVLWGLAAAVWQLGPAFSRGPSSCCSCNNFINCWWCAANKVFGQLIKNVAGAAAGAAAGAGAGATCVFCSGFFSALLNFFHIQ